MSPGHPTLVLYVPRATSMKTSPVMGVAFSKYWPFTSATYSPPM